MVSAKMSSWPSAWLEVSPPAIVTRVRLVCARTRARICPRPSPMLRRPSLLASIRAPSSVAAPSAVWTSGLRHALQDLQRLRDRIGHRLSFTAGQCDGGDRTESKPCVRAWRIWRAVVGETLRRRPWSARPSRVAQKLARPAMVPASASARIKAYSTPEDPMMKGAAAAARRRGGGQLRAGWHRHGHRAAQCRRMANRTGKSNRQAGLTCQVEVADRTRPSA